MTVVLTVAGLLGLGVVVVDIFVTVLKPGRNGFLAYRITNQVFRWARRLHRRRPSHRILSGVGVALVAALPLIWIVLMWTFWSVIYLANRNSIVDATTSLPSDGWSKVYFAGYSLFTSGLGDRIPGSSLWQIVTIATTAMGLGLVTLIVTFLVPVLQGANSRWACARRIRQHGETASEIIDCVDLLELSASGLATQFASVAEQHTSYPMLDHLHPTDAHNSLAVQLDHLHDALQQIRRCASVRMSAELRLLHRALDDLVVTITPDPLPESEARDELSIVARLDRLRLANGWGPSAAADVDGSRA